MHYVVSRRDSCGGHQHPSRLSRDTDREHTHAALKTCRSESGFVIERLRVRILAVAVGEFSSPELTFCAHSYSVSVQPRVTAVARNMVILPNTMVTPKHVYTLSRHSVETYLGNELTRNSSGNIRPQSSQLAEPLWTDSGVKSVFSERELISIYKKRKKRRRGMNHRNFPRYPRSEEKKLAPHCRHQNNSAF